MLKRSPSLQHPWEIRFKRNLPLELFDKLKLTVIVFGRGQVTRSTNHVEELVITDEDHFKNLILSWSNKLMDPTLWIK